MILSPIPSQIILQHQLSLEGRTGDFFVFFIVLFHPSFDLEKIDTGELVRPPSYIAKAAQRKVITVADL